MEAVNVSTERKKYAEINYVMSFLTASLVYGILSLFKSINQLKSKQRLPFKHDVQLYIRRCTSFCAYSKFMVEVVLSNK